MDLHSFCYSFIDSNVFLRIFNLLAKTSSVLLHPSICSHIQHKHTLYLAIFYRLILHFYLKSLWFSVSVDDWAYKNLTTFYNINMPKQIFKVKYELSQARKLSSHYLSPINMQIKFLWLTVFLLNNWYIILITRLINFLPQSLTGKQEWALKK